MRKTLFSGVVARQWRKKLAAASERVDSTTRTLKFPLELDTPPDWPAVQRLHRTVASDADGSLLAFLYAVLTAGFRVFGKTAETEAFRNQAALDDSSWHTALCASSALTLARETFVPSMIYQRLLIAPRAVGGKDTGFKDATIAIEYAKFFCKGKHGDALPDPERALFAALGVALAEAFESWAALAAAPGEAVTIIWQVLGELGYALPARSLSERIGALRACEPAGTVAFDPASVAIIHAADVVPNLIVARALTDLRRSGLDAKPELVKASQAYFTGDANHGGLAWLFGRGLVYFKETAIDDVMSDMDIPDSRRAAIERVLAAARAIPEANASFLGGKSYSSYRSGLGGVLGSWIANYCNRLFSLDEVLMEEALAPLSLSDALVQDARLFEEIGVTPDELLSLANQAMQQRSAVRSALDRLLGKCAGASVEDVAAIEAYNTLLDTLAGLLSALKERVGKEIGMATATGDASAEQVLKTYEFVVPKWIKAMEKINRLDLSPSNPKAELEAAASEFELLHDAMHRHYALIADWARDTGETLSPLQRLAAQEASRDAKRNPQEQALRASLDMIGRSARKCSDARLRLVADFFRREGVFADEADLNRYFFNRRGQLYKSPFDKNPRQPYAILKSAVDRGEEILSRYADFLVELRRDTMAAETLRLQPVSDLYRLERGQYAMRLIGFPATLPVGLALLDDVKPVFNLPLPIQLRLAGSEVSSPVLRKIFNHYYVRLEALIAVLLRDGFFLRAKLQRAGENALLYAPACDVPWNAPERLYQTEKPIGTVMRALAEVNGGAVPIDAGRACAHLAGTRNLNEPDVRAYLRQAPHGWFFPFPTGDSTTGLLLDKTGFGKRMTAVCAGRLVGTNAYKGVLDRMLVDPTSVEVGDASLLVRHEIRQTVSRTDAGRIVVQLTPATTSVEVALPVTEAAPEKVPQTFGRYVAIDLGERGFGYALFDAATHQRIEHGRVRVNSMHALVADDRAGKRKTSAVMKFRSAYDPAEERRRENVVGDFCNAINRLCWFYAAFPVLEYAAGGASKAVDKVYQMVAERYLYSTTPTVDSARKSYWMGASYWKHPLLKQYKFDKATGKKGKAIDALSLFPGVGVSAYGTSQTCSCCGRNPIEAVKRMQAAETGKKDAVFAIGKGGVISLDDGDAIVHYSAPEADRAAYRARNERVPLSHPADAGIIKGDDLIRLLRRNQRQAPASRTVQDTSISRFHCVYRDCLAQLHAEENAAINLGVRFGKNCPPHNEAGTEAISR